MYKKLLSIFIITIIISFQSFYYVKPVQANPVALASECVAYIAAAMIGAGAVGTYIPADASNPFATGALGSEAQKTYDALATVMQLELQQKLYESKTKGYMYLSQVVGLYEALHTSFLASQVVPVVVGSDYDLPTLFYTANDVRITWATNPDSVSIFVYKSGYGVLVSNAKYFYYTTNGLITSMATNADSGYCDWGVTIPALTAYMQSLYMNAYVSTLSDYNGTVQPYVPGTTVADGSVTRPISLPYVPGDLSNATKTTAYPNTAGITDTAVTSPEGIIAGDIAANIPVVVPIPDSVPITTDIATTKPGDSIDFSKLKFAAGLFTNKFPFSLPWDLLRAFSALGTGSITAPTIPFAISNVDMTVNLSLFDSLASGVRVIELFIFNIGLMFGTRKLLGGST